MHAIDKSNEASVKALSADGVNLNYKTRVGAGVEKGIEDEGDDKGDSDQGVESEGWRR